MHRQTSLPKTYLLDSSCLQDARSKPDHFSASVPLEQQVRNAARQWKESRFRFGCEPRSAAVEQTFQSFLAHADPNLADLRRVSPHKGPQRLRRKLYGGPFACAVSRPSILRRNAQQNFTD